MTYLSIWFIIWISFISNIELKIYQKIVLLCIVMLLRPLAISSDLIERYKKQIEEDNKSEPI